MALGWGAVARFVSYAATSRLAIDFRRWASYRVMAPKGWLAATLPSDVLAPSYSRSAFDTCVCACVVQVCRFGVPVMDYSSQNYLTNSIHGSTQVEILVVPAYDEINGPVIFDDCQSLISTLASETC